MFKGTEAEIVAASLEVLRLKQKLAVISGEVSDIESRLFQAINRLASLCSTEDTK